MSTNVTVYFAGEHPVQKGKEIEAAWKDIAKRKHEEFGKWVKGGKSRWSVGEDLAERLGDVRPIWPYWECLPWPEQAYMADLMMTFLDGGTWRGRGRKRDHLRLFGFKKYRFDIVCKNDDPHTAEAKVMRRLAVMDEVYPESVTSRFHVNIDIVQPVSAAMLALETGIAGLENLDREEQRCY